MESNVRWRANARAAVRRYPELTKAEENLRSGKITPSYSAVSRRVYAARTTENLAIKELPYAERRDLEAVRRAIKTLHRYGNGDLRFRLIDLCYWKRTHSVDGAAMVLHVSGDTAHEWDKSFIEIVDAFRRY